MTALNEAIDIDSSTAVAGQSEISLLCVISPHEKGFWQADVYMEGFKEGINPDWYCTGKKGDDQYEMITNIAKLYPGITFKAGITGICMECEEEHCALEEDCIYCGHPVCDA